MSRDCLEAEACAPDFGRAQVGNEGIARGLQAIVDVPGARLVKGVHHKPELEG